MTGIQTIKKPLLSAACETEDELAKLEWPALVSPKIDGIRCLMHPELGAVTRSFKPVPNAHIRKELFNYAANFMDGELVTKTNGKVDDFNTIQSKVMSRDGTPDFEYLVFDYFMMPEEPFWARFKTVREMIMEGHFHVCDVVPHVLITGLLEFRVLADQYLHEGYEGIMLRKPDGIYKGGRSTLKQQILVKNKPFADAEGTVVGFEELMRNTNEQERDAFGYSKRSAHLSGMTHADTLGALILETKWGKLKVGSGFDMAQREDIWRNQTEYLYKYCTFKYQAYGMQSVPRFPIFKGWRKD